MSDKPTDNWISYVQAVDEVAEEFHQIQAGFRPKAPSTGFAELDAVTGGLLARLIVIGAAPGVGKSALLAGMIRQLAMSGVGLALFSIEDRRDWLVWRHLSFETGISQQQLRNRGLCKEARIAVQEGFAQIRRYGASIWLDDGAPIGPEEIVEGATVAVSKLSAKCILVDHLGEIAFPAKHRDRHDLDVTEGLAAFRNFTKRHEVPFICATQLVREHSDPPTLDDFAYAAAITRMARIVIALTRERRHGNLRARSEKHERTDGRDGSATVRCWRRNGWKGQTWFARCALRRPWRCITSRRSRCAALTQSTWLNGRWRTSSRPG